MKARGIQPFVFAVALTVVFCLSFGFACETAWGAELGDWLITPEEAALPPAPPDVLAGGMRFGIGRGVPDTGPIIEVIKPASEKVVMIPVEVSIEFLPRGAPVDFSTLKVTVVKLFSIDITNRVIPFASPAGIHIPDARLPSGAHTVRISLADRDGGFTRKQITLRVP